jgi:hypothetical protein
VLFIIDRDVGESLGSVLAVLGSATAIGALVALYWLILPCQVHYRVAAGELTATWRSRFTMVRIPVDSVTAINFYPPLSWRWSFGVRYFSLPRLTVYTDAPITGSRPPWRTFPPIIFWGADRIARAERELSSLLNAAVRR